MDQAIKYTLTALIIATMYQCSTQKTIPSIKEINPVKTLPIQMDTLEIKINPNDSIPYKFIGPSQYLKKIKNQIYKIREKNEIEKKQKQEYQRKENIWIKKYGKFKTLPSQTYRRNIT